MTRLRAGIGAGCQVPNSDHAALSAAGKNLAVRRNGQRLDPTGVIVQGAPQRAGRRVPNPDQVVASAGDQRPAVGRKRHRGNAIAATLVCRLVAGRERLFFACSQIAESQRADFILDAQSEKVIRDGDRRASALDDRGRHDMFPLLLSIRNVPGHDEQFLRRLSVQFDLVDRKQCLSIRRKVQVIAVARVHSNLANDFQLVGPPSRRKLAQFN